MVLLPQFTYIKTNIIYGPLGLTTHFSVESATFPSLGVCFVLKGTFLHGFWTGKGVYILSMLFLFYNPPLSW